MLEKIVLEDTASDNWSSLVVGEENKLEIVFKLCNHRWLRGYFEEKSSDIRSTKKGDIQDDLYGMLWVSALFSRSRSVRKGAVLWKGEEI